MDEENGKLILKAPQEPLQRFTELSKLDVTEVLAELFDYACIESRTYQRETYSFDKAFVVGEYLLIKYGRFCCEWSYIADVLVQKGEGIEVYANCHCYDASTYEYYALDKTGEKLFFSLPLGNADEIMQEDEEFIEGVTEKSEQWKAMIPEPVKQASPSFSDVKLDEFLSHCS